MHYGRDHHGDNKPAILPHSFSTSLTDEGLLLRDRTEDLIAMADRIEQEVITLDDITGGDIYFAPAESFQIRYLTLSS